MLQAWKLLILRNKILNTHRTGKDRISIILGIAIAVGVFCIIRNQLQIVPDTRVPILVAIFLAGTAILGLLVALVNSVNTWFKSPDAFYLITKPFSAMQMYWYHLADHFDEFLKTFGKLILPPLVAFGLELGGTGLIVTLVLFLILLSMAICLGFFIVFYYLYNKERPIAFVILALIIGLISGLTIYLWQVSPLILALTIVVLGIPFHLGVQSYIERVFSVCMDASNTSLTVRANCFTGRILKKMLLFNSGIDSVLRAVIYMELVTEERNLFKYIRYLAVIGFILLYLPLSKLAVFVQGGFVADLIYCHLVMVLNVHDGFATMFAKDGDRLVFLWPHAYSWRLGLGKYAATLMAILPLIILLTGFLWIVNSFSLYEGLTIGAAILLLSAVHIAAVMVIGIRYLSLENRDSNLLSGMLWEQMMGNLNPAILTGFTVSLLIPACACLALLGIGHIVPENLILRSIWLLNLVVALLIGLMMLLGQMFYARKIRSLI